MPMPGDPPNIVPLVGADGRPTPPWQQWLTAIVRTLAPQRAFYIPTSDGAPMFTPEARAGFVAMAFDVTNNDLYVYDGGWLKVALA